MIIGISGMIGSGKSSLTKKLLNHYKDSMILNEFEENDEEFNVFLEWLYKNEENITMSFQSYMIERHVDKFSEIKQLFIEKGKNIYNDHLFLDRFAIEHYIFASVILQDKNPRYQQAYDSMFKQMITNEETPHFAIFLDMTHETFKKRLFARGREVEVKNYEQNAEYFAKLHSVYKSKFEQLAKLYKMPFYIIDTNNLSENQVLHQAIKIIDNHLVNKKG
ncbi:deoxyguanosine kinase [Mycoplasmopsis bovigenitalium]|uniref:deoxynucleoside kinase n=1 Tax=Mycoplasmopsis bovigenitalium TaxID=2112 RepID=UPI0009095CAB|nr:deoxynucleoside kinase [Mycoplasmopsis bovigenitalium]BAW18143.1 deoxyguanosine kinase [Mycoplasmopsis bovigenitalium]